VGSLIEAIIFDGDWPAVAVPDGLRAISLQAGLQMLPVTSELLAAMDQASIGDGRIPPGSMQRQPVAALARALSEERNAAARPAPAARAADIDLDLP
jgi:hypothetical protein